MICKLAETPSKTFFSTNISHQAPIHRLELTLL
nr:MAG TPA: hypothetical protein [Caudoviricetes sp.]